MAKQKLTVLAIVTKTGSSRKTGLAFTIRTAHCILTQHSEGGGEEVVVGTINLPSKKFEDIQPGDYLAEFSFGEGYGLDQGRLVPQIVSLTAFGTPKPQPKAA
ncbi:TPA: cellulose synthase [Burkholderia contaminans]|uniref:cellulose synthase n=1 Tax=Burkholderia TaxID=32008 RepID=UPI001CF50C06|nr:MULTISPECIES: cellulose synthase [Burkholderia]MCA7880463.1 cellulose synthase [Burkholderia contaminans]MDN8025913.1 cellulose synthase [Burkholderia contaminans]